MTAATVSEGAAGPRQIVVYRDDGPLARTIGRAAGGAVPVPAAALCLAAVLPLALSAGVTGEEAPQALAGAVVAWTVLLGGIASGRPQAGRLAWAVPPLLRIAEYGGLVWLGALAGGSAPAAAFALLCAVAFRQYDLVYRLRHRATVPPGWVGRLAGGWDGRLLVAWLAGALGVLAPVMLAAAAVLGAVFVAEAVLGWTRHQGELRPTLDDDDDEEGGD